MTTYRKTTAGDWIDPVNGDSVASILLQELYGSLDHRSIADRVRIKLNQILDDVYEEGHNAGYYFIDANDGCYYLDDNETEDD